MEEKKRCVVEVFSRITGFYRPINDWNPGKVSEFHDRKYYNSNYDLAEQIFDEDRKN